jgi:hypothetical protein
MHSQIPNDYPSLLRAVILGQHVNGQSKLGKSIEGLAIRLSGDGANDLKKAGSRGIEDGTSGCLEWTNNVSKPQNQSGAPS